MPRRHCEECGAEFQTGSRGKGRGPKRFCSRECFRRSEQLRAGYRYGHLIVLKFSHYDEKYHDAYYVFACDCGTQKTIKGSSVTGGVVISCGHVWKEGVKNYGRTHDMSMSPEYRAYMNARSRVRSKVPSTWRNYGGRGIEFKFDSFEQWFRELGPQPSPKHSVERMNNDGHYEPGNVKWATKREQSLNRVNCGKCRILEKEIEDLKRQIAALKIE